MKNSAQDILTRYENALIQKRLFRDLYEKAYKLGLPQRNLFSSSYDGSSSSINQGGRRDYELYDSTGIIAVNSFVNQMQMSLTPPFKKWVELKAGHLIGEDYEQEVNDYLENVTNKGFDIINSSNFNVVVSEFFYDLAVGTAAMMILPGESKEIPIRFISVPIEQIAIEDGVDGTVGAVFRKFSIKAKLIKEKWPQAKITNQLMHMITYSPETEVDVIECTYKYKNKFFYDVISCLDNEKLVEDVIPFNPWIVTRIGKTAVESYGRGPLVQCLADLQMLNKIKELSIKSAQYNVFGLYTVSDNDVINPNTLRLSPGTFITVARNGGPNGPSIAPLPQAGNVNMQQLMAAELQSNIKNIMLNDRLPPEIGPVRTATEVAERARSAKVNIDSYFGRLMYEFVQPLWQNIISILNIKEVINLPEALEKIDNNFLKINVLSPIAKEQGFQEVQNIINSVESIRNIGGQELVMMTFNLEEVAKFIADKIGTPASLVLSNDEVLQLKQQMIAQQQQQAMANAQQDMIQQ